MKKMFVAFSHKLTPAQIEDAKVSLGVTGFVHLLDVNPKLQAWMKAIPATATTAELFDAARSIVELADENGCTVGLFTGEPTLTIHMNNLAQKSNIRCVMSTTERGLDSEVVQPDGSVRKVQNFNHVCWRNIFLSQNHL